MHDVVLHTEEKKGENISAVFWVVSHWLSSWNPILLGEKKKKVSLQTMVIPILIFGTCFLEIEWSELVTSRKTIDSIASGKK